MRRLFYITRSYLPETTGGVIVRAHTVNLLRADYDVTVITCQQARSVAEQGVDRIPAPGNIRLLSYLERLGLKKDYLEPWAIRISQKYADIVNKDDIVLCTSGGEMGSLYAGFLLKQITGCRYVINLRDPSTYTKVNGLKIDNKFHVPRDRFEKILIREADLVITSSEFNKCSLVQKYPEFQNKIINNYFGYIFKAVNNEKTFSKRPSFAYGGRFGVLQKPELFAKAFEDFSNIDVTFIGKYKNYKPIWKYTDRYNFIEFMPQELYHEYLAKNVNVGLLSLSSDYLGACVPAKLFDYIGLGLPVLGLLPKGDAYDIINSNNFGRACYYDDIKRFKEDIEFMCDENHLNDIHRNLRIHNEEWSMSNQFRVLIDALNSLVD